MRVGGSTERKMIQWLAFKTFAKKAWVWFKNYWYYPAIVVVAIVAWCLGMRGNNGVLKMFEASKESYQKEIAVLKKAHEQEIEKRNELVEKHNQALKKIEEDYKIKLDELLTMNRKTGFYQMIEMMMGKIKNVRN